MIRSRIIIGFLSGLLMFAAVGCGGGTNALPSDSGQPPAPPSGGSNASAPDSTPKETTPTVTVQKIKVYYSDEQLMELRSWDTSVTFKDDQEKYQLTFELLTQSPSSGYEPLWESMQLNDIRLESGKLIVDVRVASSQQLGSTGEMFAIIALQNSFFQYEEIQSIQLLVEGQPAETLMGHVDISKPFQRP